MIPSSLKLSPPLTTIKSCIHLQKNKLRLYGKVHRTSLRLFRVSPLLLILSFSAHTHLYGQSVTPAFSGCNSCGYTLAGTGIIISSPTLTCAATAEGTYSGATTPLPSGFGSGIVLTDGGASLTFDPAST